MGLALKVAVNFVEKKTSQLSAHSEVNPEKISVLQKEKFLRTLFEAVTSCPL